MAEPPTGREVPRLDLSLRLQTARADGLAVRLLEFTHAEGGELPAFEAGAHLLVETGPGVVRSYSLCNAPGKPGRYQLGVLLEEACRGGSLAMHALQPGQVVRISAPRNAFALDESAPYSLLLAGGIGITHLIAMAERLAATGRDFELHYCCRERQRASFLDRLHEPRFATCSGLVPKGERISTPAVPGRSWSMCSMRHARPAGRTNSCTARTSLQHPSRARPPKRPPSNLSWPRASRPFA